MTRVADNSPNWFRVVGIEWLELFRWCRVCNSNYFKKSSEDNLRTFTKSYELICLTESESDATLD